jgi:acetylornithine deacetylase
MPIPPPITFLQELVRLGRDGEAAVQARVAAALAGIGCVVETVDYDPAAVVLKEEFAAGQVIQPGTRRAVLGRLAGSGGVRSLILFAHPDSEPHGDLSGWSVDPFAGVERDGRIVGFGVADDLSGVAAMVSALALVRESGRRPAGDVIIASTPSKRHARGVAALLAQMPPPDAALYLHPAESGMGMAEVKACTPGLLEFRISFAGARPDTAEPGQTAFAHRAVSAATVQAALLAALAELDAARGDRIRHVRIAEFVGRATNLHVSHARLGTQGRRNTVAVEGVIEGAVSMPPGERLDAVRADITAAVDTVFAQPPFDRLPKPEIAFLAGVAGAEVPVDHPLFRTADAAITAIVGRPAFVNPVHTASDIRVPILQAGIPTIGLGPFGGDLTQNRFVDEWVDAADHARCVAVVAQIIRDWCG